jgi:uncharacterized RDD family membrane protein YckC
MASELSPVLTVGRQGHYAGVVSRGLAFAADLGVLWGIYSLIVFGVSLAAQLITGNTFKLGSHQAIDLVVLTVWWFVYFAYQWASGGRTVGMAIFGLRVVQKDGQPISVRQAMLRAVLMYASFLFAFVAAIWILLQRERRSIHDLIAGTAVVYNWDARAARLRWLAKYKDGESTVAFADKGQSPI